METALDAVDIKVRSDWKKEEIGEIYKTSLLKLIFKAGIVHYKFHTAGEIQVCTLMSIKTGGCTEDCAYCAQSAKYKTDIEVHSILEPYEVIKAAAVAKKNGSSRFCMGASWRGVKENKDFEKILSMIREIKKLQLEVCCSLGMINKEQAIKLKEAGLTAYNHNLDTGENFYDKIVTTRTFQDRLSTLRNIMEAKISVCSGGIIGMGESEDDRIEMIATLANMPVHPESVPVNMLIPIEGTPLENQATPSIWEVAKIIATIRIVMPETRIRLSAGRSTMSYEQQTLCFLAGANSIFAGEKLLTADNVHPSKDQELFEILGIHACVK